MKLEPEEFGRMQKSGQKYDRIRVTVVVTIIILLTSAIVILLWGIWKTNQNPTAPKGLEVTNVVVSPLPKQFSVASEEVTEKTAEIQFILGGLDLGTFANAPVRTNVVKK